MSDITIEFKFDIGQLVYIKTGVDHYNKVIKPVLEKSKGWEEPDLLLKQPLSVMILSKHIEQCHGGVQIAYDVRMYNNGAAISTRFFEFELTESL